jgi:hypothetical protein
MESKTHLRVASVLALLRRDESADRRERGQYRIRGMEISYRNSPECSFNQCLAIR